MSATPTRAGQAGFTLIEVMVTVVVVAMLAAIAIPIYNNYIERSYVQQGLQRLSEARTRMEQYFLDNRKYVSAGTTCGFDVAKLVTSSDKFTLDCVGDATSYTVTATGRTGSPMAAFVYTINETSVLTSTISKPGWGTGTKVNCWVTKPGEGCPA